MLQFFEDGAPGDEGKQIANVHIKILHAGSTAVSLGSHQDVLPQGSEQQTVACLDHGSGPRGMVLVVERL